MNTREAVANLTDTEIRTIIEEFEEPIPKAGNYLVDFMYSVSVDSQMDTYVVIMIVMREALRRGIRIV